MALHHVGCQPPFYALSYGTWFVTNCAGPTLLSDEFPISMSVRSRNASEIVSAALLMLIFALWYFGDQVSFPLTLVLFCVPAQILPASRHLSSPLSKLPVPLGAYVFSSTLVFYPMDFPHFSRIPLLTTL